jgi:putative addiction module component (TIGR02574 family)
MTTEDVKALPIEQKIQIMEAIWEDLRERFDRMEISEQQKELLDRRRARVEKGEALLLDWDSVKGTIGR